MLGTINLYNIYCGNFTGSASVRATTALVDYFATHFGSSSLYNVISAYTGRRNSSSPLTRLSASLRFAGSTTVLPSAVGPNTTLSRLVVMKQIVSVLRSNRFPVDENGIYTFIFRGDLTYSGFLTDWCGFHSHIPIFFKSYNISIKYAVVGDVGTAPVESRYACAQLVEGTVNGNVGGDSLVNIYAHEVVECATDPLINAWYFSASPTCQDYCAGLEVADICNWNFLTPLPTDTSNVRVGDKWFLVQSMWQPGFGCVLSKR